MNTNNFSDDDLIHIAERRFGAAARPISVTLRREDRRRHFYGVGESGTGKSTLIERMIIQDIVAGDGVALIDPHGTTASKLLDFIPPRRAGELLYFNVADQEHPIGFNLLSGYPANKRHLAVDAMVTACRSFWSDSWGVRLEYLLANAVAAAMELPDGTFLTIQRLINDAGYRVRVAQRLTDPAVRNFWLVEFADYQTKFRTEAVAPLQNKIGRFLMTPLMRNIFGQAHDKIDARFKMDNRRIVIANLAKGAIGESNANLIGAFLITAFELAANARLDTFESDLADVPTEPIDHPDFYLYVDEFQNFGTESIKRILSEARKMRLSLAIFNQYAAQLDQNIQHAVLGTVGTIATFRVGSEDADILSRQFAGALTARDLIDLDNFEVALRPMVHGRKATAFRAFTARPDAVCYGKRRNMIIQSRMSYAKTRETVELAINPFLYAGGQPKKRRPSRRRAITQQLEPAHIVHHFRLH
jgi:hypothetical protein